MDLLSKRRRHYFAKRVAHPTSRPPSAGRNRGGPTQDGISGRRHVSVGGYLHLLSVSARDELGSFPQVRVRGAERNRLLDPRSLMEHWGRARQEEGLGRDEGEENDDKHRSLAGPPAQTFAPSPSSCRSGGGETNNFACFPPRAPRESPAIHLHAAVLPPEGTLVVE